MPLYIESVQVQCVVQPGRLTIMCAVWPGECVRAVRTLRSVPHLSRWLKRARGSSRQTSSISPRYHA